MNIQFIHSPFDGQLAYFQFFGYWNKAAKDTHRQVFFIPPKSRFPGHKIGMCFVL